MADFHQNHMVMIVPFFLTHLDMESLLSYFMKVLLINHQRACVRVKVVTCSVCLSVCLSQTDFEDGFILSLQMGIKARQATV